MQPEAALVRLNFVALVTALDALASGRAEAADPERYESLPENGSRLAAHAGHERDGGRRDGRRAVHRRTSALRASRLVREVNGRAHAVMGRPHRGSRRSAASTARCDTIDATGLVAAPALRRTLREGDEVTLPDWTTWKGATLSVGEPGALLLLEPIAGQTARYVVKQIVRP